MGGHGLVEAGECGGALAVTHARLTEGPGMHRVAWRRVERCRGRGVVGHGAENVWRGGGMRDGGVPGPRAPGSSASASHGTVAVRVCC